MEHTHIVTASDLADYANTKDSEAVIPELIWMLVKESAAGLTMCRIPYGDSINQPGWDGLVETEGGFRQFVPQEKSFWEIGTGGDPQGKATEDFTKRTRKMKPEERQEATYVFVTPHGSGSGGWDEPAQTKWINRRKKFKWGRIKILDGVQMADWLREFPAIGKWLFKRIGLVKAPSGFSTPAEHWENLQQLSQPNNDPPLPPKLFLSGREQACAQLLCLFRGETKQLLLVAENENEAEDFVAACLADLDADTRRLFSNRCIFVRDADAWHSMANLKSSHVLVAHPTLDLEDSGEQLHMAANKNGHGVVIPLSGSWATGSDKLIPLRSPSAAMIETTLTDCGYKHDRARELAAAGALNLGALKRYLRGLGELPPYATWESARLLAQAGLLGRWAGENPADKAAVEKLLGKSYGEWIETVRPETLRSDTPLTQRNENWKIISRSEAWSALGPRLCNDDLDRFQIAALDVLGEKDPSIELTAEERLTADLSGKVLKHSSLLRRGMADTLALLGSRPNALSSCSQGKARLVAILTVRQLLKDADWVRWASLNHQLPLLAEAAPEEFLDAVEHALLQPTESPFRSVFSKEEPGVMGWNYMTGLLWGLETLAWHPDHLARVTLLLGELAGIDPGGNWANRPANSLATIFLPWFPQTCADIPKRKSAVEALLREQPAVGWKLVLSLLPSMHSSSMGSRKPTWRDFIPRNWTEGATHQDRRQQVLAYADLAASSAAADLSKLAELIERLPDVPNPAHSRILEHLATNAVLGLSESDRLPLWEALVDLASRHRFFGDAKWAIGIEGIGRLEEAAAKLAPKSANLLYRRLFSNRDSKLFDGKHGEVDYNEQERKLELRRQAAVLEILKLNHLTGVLEFTKHVASPEKVGLALGCVAPGSVDAVLLPKHLGTEEKPLAAFVAGFVWGRLGTNKWSWVDALPIDSWPSEQKAAFLVLLPFVKDTWQRAAQLLGADEGAYWKKANVNPWGADESLLNAVQKLLDHGRPLESVRCFSRLLFNKVSFPPELAVRALMDSLKTADRFHALDQYETGELIKWLQDNPATDPNALFQIEWSFLQLLDRHSGGSPKTLERRLATSPSFFCEVIRTVFRSDKDERKNGKPTERERNIATNAYRLLREWQTAPGFTAENSFDGSAFEKWLDEVEKISADSGHLRIAMNQIGQVLPHAPADADGLWIHHSVAEALNAKDASEMRSGFTCELMNMRGVFTFTGGKEEREIAARYRNKSEALEQRGYARFATAMRELAEHYEHDAEREAARDPFED
jgi:hypothetical protein